MGHKSVDRVLRIASYTEMSALFHPIHVFQSSRHLCSHQDERIYTYPVWHAGEGTIMSGQYSTLMVWRSMIHWKLPIPQPLRHLSEPMPSTWHRVSSARPDTTVDIRECAEPEFGNRTTPEVPAPNVTPKVAGSQVIFRERQRCGLDVILPAHDLGRLHGIHLLRPSWSGYEPADSADLVGRITRNADIVVTLENHLNVAHVELR